MYPRSTLVPMLVCGPLLLLAGCMQSTKMGNTDTVVTTQPTMETMSGMGGKAVLYDDGKCPPGQIAQYTKRGGRTQINRVCVARGG